MRGKFEEKVYAQLVAERLSPLYEEDMFEYHVKIRNGVCDECGSKEVIQSRWYLADFTFINSNIVLEAKGRFQSKDRAKMITLKEQHPDIDFRMVFYYNAKLPLKRTPTHLEWAEYYGFKACVQKIPREWVEEIKHR